ncbi:hypothetical protein SELMODRAFT_100448 [Selaginella moellendorffii]|uniref:Pentacotripeptide-repeat region of PRORP domain-containing protein n=2 Tax=Selaginella moellendorffii TaxID=88036 RepID=D8RSR8_SELML|nr:hypothetical protein SELMODRAFT_100448 [Selaginella moellendorffii]
MPEKTEVSWGTIIAAYARNGHIRQARRLFDAMPRPDLESWNAVLAASARSGESLALLRLMCVEGIAPNAISLLGVMNSCSHLGLVDEGVRIFASLQWDLAIAPMKEHYCCVIDLLGRSGDVEAAGELSGAMPSGGDVVAWITVLASRSVQRGDHERIECAALMERARSLNGLSRK